MYQLAKVAVENAAYAYDKLYSYLLPEELAGKACPGCRVTVPFGGGNRRRTGIVLETEAAEDCEKIKPVFALLDEKPLLDDEGLMMLRYLKEYTFCTWFDALRLLIPAGIGVVYKTIYKLGVMEPQGLSVKQAEIVAWLGARRGGAEQDKLCGYFNIEPKDKELLALVEAGVVTRSEQTGQKVRDEKVCMVRLTDAYRPERLTEKQRQVAAFLEENETAALAEICYYTGVTRVVVDNMKKRGQVDYYDAARYRSPYGEEIYELAAAPELTGEQRSAFEQLEALTREQKPAPALLYGVTGSGKSEVYLALIEQVTGRDKTALVLVPEISLTAQAVDSFRRRFGDEVAVLHSGLSLGERMDEWKRIRSGEARIAVGTRSAVFAPLRNIGLIVIDEEQEHTYRSERTPRFHAREVALRRAAWHGALLLLSSATPAVETYYHAKQGRYHLVTLAGRWGTARLPDVYTVDMREAENLSHSPAFSQLLLEEMRYNLERGEQSILLLNRRGYATVVKCSACGEVAECPNCSVAMTYHAANDSLVCHYCGYQRDKAASCSGCGSALIRYAGTGTQKLEQELAALFPDARVLRVDMDTTMAKYSHDRLFAAFAAHEYDIMIGTQMVAKGLNFPDVTLVGVLGADQSLYAGDFRGYERSFSLLTQVVGRCGRGEKRGRAIVQTYSPDHPVIELAAHQNYTAFYEQEIRSRELHLYPPFCTMVGVGFVGEALEDVRGWSARYLEQFRATAAAEYPGLPLRALGPVPSEILRVAGKYRYKLILKCRNTAATRALLTKMQQWFLSQCKTVSIFVDMHYDRI